MQPPHRRQRREAQGHQLDSEQGREHRHPLRHPRPARLELQRHLARRWSEQYLPLQDFRADTQGERLSYHPLRQSAFRRNRNPRGRSAQTRFRREHSRTRRRRSGLISVRRQLRPRCRRHSRLGLRDSGAGEVLGQRHLPHRGAHAGGPGGPGHRFRPVFPLHGALRRACPHRPRPALLPKIPRQGHEREGGGLRRADRRHGQEPWGPDGLAGRPRPGRRHRGNLHVRQRRVLHPHMVEGRAPLHPELSPEQRQGLGIRGRHTRAHDSALARSCKSRQPLRHAPHHRRFLPRHTRNRGHTLMECAAEGGRKEFRAPPEESVTPPEASIHGVELPQYLGGSGPRNRPDLHYPHGRLEAYPLLCRRP